MTAPTSLSAIAWLDLVRAQGAILHATWRVRTVAVGDLVSTRKPATPNADTERARPRPRLPNRAWALALAVERAAKYGVLRPQCLVKSVALQHLLDAAGIEGSKVCVGVRRESRGANSELLAHAWVELSGVVLGDRPDYTGTFARMDALGVTAFE